MAKPKEREDDDLPAILDPGGLFGAAPSAPPAAEIPDLVVPVKTSSPKISNAPRSLGNAETVSVSSPPTSNREMQFDDDDEVHAKVELDAPPSFSGMRTFSPAPTAASLRYARDMAPVAPAKKKSSVVPVLVLLLVAAAVVTVFHEAPPYVMRACIAAAARQGVTMTIERVSIRPTAITLGNVKAHADALPDVTATADEVLLTMGGLQVKGIVLRNFELTLSGSIADVAAHFDAWRSAVHEPPLHVYAQAGHVLWAAPLGASTKLESFDTSIDLVTGGASPAGLHALAPSAMLRTGRGNLGPWRLAVDRSSGKTSVGIAFDPAAPERASLQIDAPVESPGTARLVIPRSPLGSLGIAPEILGAAVDDRTEIEVALDVGPAADGQGSLTVVGMKAPGNAPVDVKLDITVHRAAPGTLGVAGSLRVGALSGKLGGPVTTDATGARAELTWTPPERPCATSPPGAKSQGAPARRDAYPVIFTLDSHDVGAASATPTLPGCVAGVATAPPARATP